MGLSKAFFRPTGDWHSPRTAKTIHPAGGGHWRTTTVKTIGTRPERLLAPLDGMASRGDMPPRTWRRGCDVLARAPVPIQAYLTDGIEAVLARQQGASLGSVSGCFPPGQGGWSPFHDLRWIRRLDDFPNLVISAEYGNLFNRRFYDTYARAGAFRTEQPGPVPAAAVECGLIDPQGMVAVYAVAPFVFLIDHRRLDGRRPPRRWADLLDPSWRNQLVFGGWRREGETRFRDFNKFILMGIYREAGLAGVARFAANVAALTHSAEMPRIVGTDRSVGGVYILPWSLADICPRRQVSEIIWPEDGALAYPLWMVGKAAGRERVAAVERYLFSAEVGRYLNGNRYPSLSPHLPSSLPVGGRLKWLGWDFVRDRATATILREACQIFFEEWPAANNRAAPLVPDTLATERLDRCA